MSNTSCSYRSPYSDSGDRGADMSEHMRAFHPTHAHNFILWAEGTDYGWSKEPRCETCGLAERDDSSGKCLDQS